jgi:uncharacterized FlaG/YvyC family protein
MTSPGHIEFGASAPPTPTTGTRLFEEDRAKPADDRANSAPAKTSAPAPDEKARREAAAFDERTLDRMALRLVKRDPGLAIEIDDIVRRYVYRFFDSESGDQIRQFPADRVLETMRALRQVSDGLARQDQSADVAV